MQCIKLCDEVFTAGFKRCAAYIYGSNTTRLPHLMMSDVNMGTVMKDLMWQTSWLSFWSRESMLPSESSWYPLPSSAYLFVNGFSENYHFSNFCVQQWIQSRRFKKFKFLIGSCEINYMTVLPELQQFLIIWHFMEHFWCVRYLAIAIILLIKLQEHFWMSSLASTIVLNPCSNLNETMYWWR